MANIKQIKAIRKLKCNNDIQNLATSALLVPVPNKLSFFTQYENHTYYPLSESPILI